MPVFNHVVYHVFHILHHCYNEKMQQVKRTMNNFEQELNNVRYTTIEEF